MKRKCKVSHCTAITDGATYCAAHTKEPSPKKRYESHKFYSTQAWQRLSKSVRSEYPICQVCNQKISDVVDHHYEIRYPDGEYYKLDARNLTAMCHQCHNNKTQQLSRRLRNGKPSKATWTWLEKYAIDSEQLDLIQEIRKGLEETSC
ncbi:TPA: HNH endonuclease [Aeromonas dhakensis]|nr:HNH endonuclease [Aeromonas dhakensis]